MKQAIVWIALLLFGAGWCKAQTPKTLLWEISGKALAKPAYLFGTIHLLCESDFKIPGKVTRTLNACDQLVFETNLFDSSAMQEVMKGSLSDTLISQKLSPAIYARLDSSVKAQTGLSVQQFDHYKLSTLFAMVTVLTVKCKPKQYETELREIGLQHHIRFGELETLSEQMDYFNKGFPDDYCVEELIKTDLGAQFAELVQAYLAEDLDKLNNMLGDEAKDNPDMNGWIVDKRNANWAQRIPGIMGKGGTFFAVGAMHLPGPNGVIALLKKNGYTVKPVMN